MGILTLVLFLAFVACGCSSVTHTAVSPAQDEKKCTTGIRYYDSSPYLLVQRDPADATGKTWTSQLLYLPDLTKMRQAKLTCVLAVNTSSFAFTNAILTDSSVAVDSTAVPAAVLQALVSAATSVAKGAVAMDNVHPADVKLFKIVARQDKNDQPHWNLIGAYAPQLSIK